MPKDGLALLIPVFITSIILAFGPERIIVWSGQGIKRLWSAA